MNKQYFYQQFYPINNEKMKRQEKFIKRMRSKLRLKKASFYRRNHHHFAE